MNKIYVVALHAGYWLLFFLLVVFLYTASQLNAEAGPSISMLATLLIGFVLIPAVISFYGSYFFLFYIYIKKAKPLKLFIGTCALVALACTVSLLCIYLRIPSSQAWLEIVAFVALFSGFNATVGFILRSFIAWFTDVKVKEELSKKTQALEMELVKLKMDPHFLFNTINNVDVLIETDPAKASEYLVKLASILRFYVYKSANATIALQDELTYLQAYIELQKIRTSNHDYVHLQIEGEPGQHKIAPMVLIPFIENAFKHTSNKKTAHIVILISIQEHQLEFMCSNAISESNKKEKGIGNQLIEDRLRLIYGTDFELKNSITEGKYCVNLRIPV